MAETKTNNQFVDLSKIEGIPHIPLFHEVAKLIAEDNLDAVNKQSGVSVRPSVSFYTKYGKRCIDIIISSLALLITLPINLLMAIGAFIDVGRPILFHQQRIGKNGELFTITKFRNMTNAVNERGELLPPDMRVTKYGKFVRRTSLDELLNFWSIFKGDMTIIGPRPLSIEYIDRYSERHKGRYLVKPGLECPMIHKTDGQLTWKDQFDNDVYYVEHCSFSLDVKMCFLLIRMVFDRKGTKMRSTATRGSFMGYNRDGTSINAHAVPSHYVERAIDRLSSEEKIA